MNTSLIVRVLATKKSGGRKIGTGCFINKELIITARHVVMFADRAADISIDIEIPQLKNSKGMTPLKRKAKIIYEGGDQYDIAILKCQTPIDEENTQKSAYLSPSTNRPDYQKDWDSFGYPRFAKDAGVRYLDQAKGEFFEPDDSRPLIQLTSKGDTKNKEDWGGMSGAPVIQHNKLYAIIVKVPLRVNERFQAISLHWLLANVPKFKRKLLANRSVTKKIPKEKGNFKSILAKKISRELQRPDARPLLDGLEDELDINEDDELDKLKALTDELLSLETDDAVNNYLSYVTEDCIEKNGGRYEESQGKISQIKKAAEEILGWLVLSSVDEDEIVRLLPGIEAESLYFVLGHTTLGGVELALSRRFQHQTRWERSKDVHQTGKYHIPVESSYFTDDNQVEINKLLLAVWNAVVGCEEQKKGNLSSNDIKQLNAKIKRLRKDKRSPRHYYFAFDTDSINPSRSQEIFSQLLSSDYLHEMTVVEMGSDQGSKVLLVDEFDIIEAISGFYEMIRNGDSSHKNTENKETTSA